MSNEIWILECGSCYEYEADCGGYYLNKEDALKHPLFEKYCSVQEFLNPEWPISDKVYRWGNNERWIALYSKSINKHFLNSGERLTFDDYLR
jgi:hypothetical protein